MSTTARSPAPGTRALHVPAGSATSGPYALEVTPETAGWGHASLCVLELAPGA
jgi:5-deoxy-glucuronate isomerase